jgi:hypothetical protein
MPKAVSQPRLKTPQPTDDNNYAPSPSKILDPPLVGELFEGLYSTTIDKALATGSVV